MYEEFYRSISAPFRNHPAAWKCLLVLNRFLTLLGYLSYLILLWKLKENPEKLSVMIIVPGIAFTGLSIYRKRHNAQRPYEQYAIDPLIIKEKKGNSFPSRHTFSMCLIGICWFAVSWKIGLGLALSGILLGMVRIIGGVHFPKDIVYGAGIGYLCGLITLGVEHIIG